MAAEHRFQVRDKVRVAARLSANPVEAFMDVVTSIDVQHRGEVWEVVRLLPADQSGFQYQIRAEGGLVRVVHEAELISAELSPSNSDWIALDGDRSIGRVYQITAGPESGLWFWTMTATRPGVSRSGTNGRAQTRGEAGRCVVAAYERVIAAAASYQRQPSDLSGDQELS
jgi:hypothetical protein